MRKRKIPKKLLKRMYPDVYIGKIPGQSYNIPFRNGITLKIVLDIFPVVLEDTDKLFLNGKLTTNKGTRLKKGDCIIIFPRLGSMNSPRTISYRYKKEITHAD